jgi:carbonic anhydrase
MTKYLFNLAIASLLLASLAIFGPGQKRENKVTADSVLAELKVGNAHHVAHRYTHPHETANRQRELVSVQHPHAEILSCSDSRVPPELIFDQGLGDLFIIRVAGNVVSDSELGSLEYGAEHLHVPLLVVMGHQHCGAVTAAIAGEGAEGHIAALINLLRPAVEKTRGIARRPGNKRGAGQRRDGGEPTSNVNADTRRTRLTWETESGRRCLFAGDGKSDVAARNSLILVPCLADLFVITHSIEQNASAGCGSVLYRSPDIQECQAELQDD